jgi:hypothetical protein
MNFARAVHNWEVDAFVSFLKMLYLARMRREGEGKLCWVPSKRGLFGVKSFYRVMDCCHDGFCFSWKSVWRTKVSLRVAFFCVVGGPKKNSYHGQPP